MIGKPPESFETVKKPTVLHALDVSTGKTTAVELELMSDGSVVWKVAK